MENKMTEDKIMTDKIIQDKAIEDKFVADKTQEIPDLWSRICDGIDALPEEEKETSTVMHIDEMREAGKNSKSEKKKAKFKWKRAYTGIAAAAAAACLVIIAVPIGMSIGRDSKEASYEYASDYGASYGYERPAMSAGGAAVYSEEAAAEEDYAMDADYAEEAADNLESPAEGSHSDVAGDLENYGKKLIKTVSVQMETLQFDESYELLKQKVEAYGGYFESSDISQERYGYKLKYGSFVIKIPAEKLEAFNQETEGVGNIINANESAVDVTVQYVDTTSHIEALETQQATLLNLLEKAESMEDILAVENALTSVRYELNYYQSLKQSYDHQVKFATVNLDLNEVKEETAPEPVTIGSRMREGFVGSLNAMGRGFVNFLVGIVAAAPFLMVLAVIVVVVIIVCKVIIKKHNNKKDKSKDK